MHRSPLTDEAFQALFRMKQDIYAVGAVASECGTSCDRAVLKLILRNAARGVVRAFSTFDGQREEAWKHVVLLVDELLRHRLQFRGVAYDRVELSRLQAFVRENPDAFEHTSYLHLVRTGAG